MLKRLTIILFLMGLYIHSIGQSYHPVIESIISDIQLDSLISQVRYLSGEDSVLINGNMQLLEHRVDHLGNELAGEYLMETFEQYNLEVNIDSFDFDGINVIAIQKGTVYPDEYYILCAHYDAVDLYCADDNASGTAAVLEAARILSKLEFDYSLIYALWDKEEIGLIGSQHYALRVYEDSIDIRGVINLDMIAWDGDMDMQVELHSNGSNESDNLAYYLKEIDSIYKLDLVPIVYDMGISASDHASFWQTGYPAILIIEEFMGGDFNPYYHSDADRIDKFDLNYFYQNSCLAIAGISSLAIPSNGSNFIVNNAIQSEIEMKAFPNPFTDQTKIMVQYEPAGDFRLSLLNCQGELVQVLVNKSQSIGRFEANIERGVLPAGMYLLRAVSSYSTSTIKLLIE